MSGVRPDRSAPAVGLGAARTTALFAIFTSFGAIFGLIGPAWVGMAPDLGLEPADLPIVTVPLVVGRLLGALTAPALGGRVERAVRFLALPVMLGGGLLLAAGVLGREVAWVVVGLSITGLAGGLLDVTVNEVLSAEGRSTEAVLVHGGYGVGAVGGPLLLVVGFDWAPALAITGLAAISSALVAPVADGGRHRRRIPAHDAGGAEQGGERVPFDSGIWLLVGLAGAAGAVEVVTAQWAPTVLSETAGWSEERAAAVGAGFWAVLTVVRLVVGLAPGLVPPGLDGRPMRVVMVVGSVLMVMAGVAAAGGALVLAVGVSTALPFLVVEAGRRRGPRGISATLVAAAVASVVLLGVSGPLVSVFSERAVGVILLVLSAGIVVGWPRSGSVTAAP